MKIAALITAAFVLCMTLPGGIDARRKPKPYIVPRYRYCRGNDGNRYNIGEEYLDTKACIRYTCVRAGKGAPMNEKKVPQPCTGANANCRTCDNTKNKGKCDKVGQILDCGDQDDVDCCKDGKSTCQKWKCVDNYSWSCQTNCPKLKGTGGNNVEDVVGETTQCAITQADVNASMNMPNVNYFLRGYNIMKGNPHQVSVSSVDPGFQEPIFKLCYDDRGETPDGRYLQPDGTLITMCQSCSLSAVTKKISGMDAYKESLSEKVKATDIYNWLWPWWEYRFSWSSDYQNVESGIYKHSSYYTHSDASCCAYQIQTDTYAKPPFSQDFIDGVNTLTAEYDEAIYKRFIEAFGTHYVKQADMGSLFGQQTEMSKEHWTEIYSWNYTHEQVSSWSAMIASGSLKITDQDGGNYVSKFNKMSSSQTLYTTGSKPPKDGSMTNWVNEAKNYPAPISLELGSILNLFTALNVRQRIYDNMKTALDNYCGSNCEEIQNNPWMTNINMGQRSDPMTCVEGDYVSWIQFSRGNVYNNESEWIWPYGLDNLCFGCSHDESTAHCFNDTSSLPPYLGYTMICPHNGFQKMTTYTPEFYPSNPINVKAQCNRDSEPQYAFNYWFAQNWAPWVSCHDKKIVGFQVLRNGFGRIVNFRMECA